MSSIPLSRPHVDDDVKRAVTAVLDSRQYILGPECEAFEADLAAYVGVRHAVLTSSGTAALWMALKALGVKAGDEVLVPAHTAFPTVEAICFAEATPAFVDVDAGYTLDPVDAAGKITPRTVGIVPVHLYGQPCDVAGVTIQTGVHYPVPGHRQPAVEHLAASTLPETERLVDEILTLPLSAGHTDAEVDQVAEAAREFFGG